MIAMAASPPDYDVFLCHNTKDKPVVRRLCVALQERNIWPWLDEDVLSPGGRGQEDLGHAISSIPAAIVCIGPSGLGKWQIEEALLYIERSVNGKARVIPVLLPGSTDEPELPGFLQTRTRVDLRDGLTDEGMHRLICGIRGTKPAETSMPSAERAADEGPKRSRSRQRRKVASHDPSSTPMSSKGKSKPGGRRGSAPSVQFSPVDEASVQLDDFKSAVGEHPLLLMTAVEVEFKAVRSLMLPLPNKNGFLVCYKGQETYCAGFLGKYRVVLTMCGMGGSSRDGVIGAALDAIDRFAPGAIIMIGMGFGADDSKQRLGDVMVSSQVIAYELSRVGETATISRGPHTEAGPMLLNRVRNAKLNWDHRVNDRTVGVHCGAMLSGEKLIDNRGFKARLLEEFPKAIGGDMEGAGLYAAAARRKLEWIVVKGIADWADGTKTKDWQPFAALAAATLVETVLLDPLSLAELCPPDVPGKLPKQAETAAISATSTARIARHDGEHSQQTAQAAERARLILVEALQVVCKDLNSDQAPFPSLREEVQRDLSKELSREAPLNPESLEQLLKNRLIDLMCCLCRWLDKQKELAQIERLREIIDVFAAAGMDRTWIEEMKARISDVPHIEAPTWTEIELCEPLLTGLFGEAATWTRLRHLNHDFIQVETPGTDPESRKTMIRSDLSKRCFGYHLDDGLGESDDARKQRLKQLIDTRLPRLLAFHRKLGKPYFVLYYESAAPLKTEMERDKEVWDEILKIERRGDRDGVIFEDVELGEALREIFAKLDEFTQRKMSGNL
jgi:nucleoside phosphorylase